MIAWRSYEDRMKAGKLPCFYTASLRRKPEKGYSYIWKMTGNRRYSMKSNYTYMVKCSDGTLYTGWTTDLEQRMKAHNDGSGAKYTRSRRPVELVYYEEYETKVDAMKREYAIKQLTRKQKEQLIKQKHTLLKNDRCFHP